MSTLSTLPAASRIKRYEIFRTNETRNFKVEYLVVNYKSSTFKTQYR